MYKHFVLKQLLLFILDTERATFRWLITFQTFVSSLFSLSYTDFFLPTHSRCKWLFIFALNPLNAELNPIRHLLALVGARHIVHVSMATVNRIQ